jgi:hypothetical protein
MIISMIITSLYMNVSYDNELITYDHQRMITTSLFMIVFYDNEIITYDHQHDHDIIIHERLL